MDDMKKMEDIINQINQIFENSSGDNKQQSILEMVINYRVLDLLN